MRTIYRAIISIIAAAMSTACTDTPDPIQPQPVIEGWIDSDGHPVVLFTSTMQPTENGGTLQEDFIRWGKVTISDGIDEVILTGITDKDMLPPYRYYTNKITGVPGRTYSVTAKYKDLYATATCTMPEPVPIDSITLQRIEESDTLRAARLYLTAPDDVPAYFCITVSKLQEKDDGRLEWQRPLPALMGTVKASVPGQKIETGLYNAKDYQNSLNFVPQMIVGQTLKVSLCRVPQKIYDYWTQYNNMVMFGHSLFMSQTLPPQGNIEGGLGIWSAQGTSSQILRIE